MSSNTFKNKITLRFPRIERVRYDKPWHDGLTVNEFESIIKVQYILLAIFINIIMYVHYTHVLQINVICNLSS